MESEAYSSHYRGPLGSPKLDEAMQERIRRGILLLYPNAPVTTSSSSNSAAATWAMHRHDG